MLGDLFLIEIRIGSAASLPVERQDASALAKALTEDGTGEGWRVWNIDRTTAGLGHDIGAAISGTRNGTAGRLCVIAQPDTRPEVLKAVEQAATVVGRRVRYVTAGKAYPD